MPLTIRHRNSDAEYLVSAEVDPPRESMSADGRDFGVVTRPAKVYRPVVGILAWCGRWCRYFRRLLHSTDSIDDP